MSSPDGYVAQKSEGVTVSDRRKYGTAKSEAAEIKRDDAVPQKNSGRGQVDKGDAIYDGYWLVDIKEYASSFSVSLGNWAKLCTDAVRSGNLEPAFKLVLGSGLNKIRLFVISEDEFNNYRRLVKFEQRFIDGD